jgi:aspartate/methionine/tyrosine aminotransferase
MYIARNGLARDLPVFEIEKFVSDHSGSAKHHLSASDAENLTISELLKLDGGKSDDQFMNLCLGYSETRGAPRLREAIAETYEKQTAASIIAFAGAGEAIFAVCNVLFDQDDHAITVTPNYQSHEALPGALGSVSCVRLNPAQNWSLDLDALMDEIRPNTKAVIINYPHNPTGAILTAEEQDALIAICREHDLYLINDEVFWGLGPSTTQHAPAVADVYEKGVSINVLSKAYGLPGLRIGWLATQDHALVESLELFKHYLSVCPSTVGEFLGIIALNHREEIFARKREIIDGNIELWKLFFERHSDAFEPAYPAGGCIAYPRYRGGGTVEELADLLRNRYGVFVVPEPVFSPKATGTPAGHFRVGFGRLGLPEALKAFDEAMSEITSRR